jgi:peptidoglycan hydrolase CwlO-like protein
MWDALTQNLDEYGAKVEAAAKHVDDLIKEYNEVESRVDAVINSLIEFSSDIEKTNAGLVLQKNLIAELQANYGDLGISINETTGEI